MLFADGAGLGSAESPGGTRLSLASFALFPLDDFQILFFFFCIFALFCVLSVQLLLPSVAGSFFSSSLTIFKRGGITTLS